MTLDHYERKKATKNCNSLLSFLTNRDVRYQLSFMEIFHEDLVSQYHLALTQCCADRKVRLYTRRLIWPIYGLDEC